MHFGGSSLRCPIKMEMPLEDYSALSIDLKLCRNNPLDRRALWIGGEGTEEECEGTDVNPGHFLGSTVPSNRPVGTGKEI